MNSKEISTIIQLEWDMFQQLVNLDGRASRQDDPDEFAVMRQSQFSAWDPQVITSYLNDLQKAKMEGRNLVFEKHTI